MARFFLQLFIWVIPVMAQVLGCSVSGSSWCPQNPKEDARFEQKTDRFWEFDKQSNTWVEIRLPFDLLSCVNGNCTKVGSIQQTKKSADILGGLTIPEPDGDFNLKSKEKAAAVESSNEVLPIRKRISLTKMSDASIWLTGESGSIYERFWNGVQWVIAPHDLPIPAWSAVSVFIVNQTILALSDAGILYQLQLFENSHPIWTEFVPAFEPSMHSSDTEPSSTVHIKSGILSHDEKRVYFTTKNGSLLELSEFQPLSHHFYGEDRLISVVFRI